LQRIKENWLRRGLWFITGRAWEHQLDNDKIYIFKIKQRVEKQSWPSPEDKKQLTDSLSDSCPGQ
jgi:hypothetical protein